MHSSETNRAEGRTLQAHVRYRIVVSTEGHIRVELIDAVDL